MNDPRHRIFSLLPLPIFLFFTVFGVLVPGGIRAQTKVGYIDASKLLKRMPEAVDAETRLGQLISTWNHEADDIQNDLNRKSSEFDRRKLIMTDAERNAAEVEIQNLKKKIEDYRQSKYAQPGGELFTQEATLMKPAYDKLQKAIEEVARDLSYDFVFDRSSKDIVMLYANARHDLTLAVAKKLNIETDALTQPLISTPPKPGVNPNGQPGVNTQTRNGIQTAKPIGGGVPPTGQPGGGTPPVGTPPVMPGH